MGRNLVAQITENLREQISKYLSSQKRRKVGYWVLCSLGAVVVFCTTYALILPAITMSNEPICGMEAHTHDETCWTLEDVPPDTQLICADWVEADVVFHSHSDLCYNDMGELICPIQEQVPHIHEAACFIEERTLTCELEGIELNEDGSMPELPEVPDLPGVGEISDPIVAEPAVAAPQPTPEPVAQIMAQPEPEEIYDPGHTHTDECYMEIPGELICGQEESEGHYHDDSCYANEATGEFVQVCGMDGVDVPVADPETGLVDPSIHVHTNECYEPLMDRVLVCYLEESEGHIHDEFCYSPAERILICEEEEREESWTVVESEPVIIIPEVPEIPETPEISVIPDLRVDTVEPEEEIHIHTEECYEVIQTPVCGEEEFILHTHGDECYMIIREENILDEFTEIPEITEIDVNEPDVLDELDVLDEFSAVEPTELEAQKVLICELPVVVEHVHTEDCVEETEREGERHMVFSCELPEHVHGDACYVPLGPDPDPHACGLSEHTHTDDCYFESGELRCTVPEHTHTDECLDPDNFEDPEYPLEIPEEEEVKYTQLLDEEGNPVLDENGNPVLVDAEGNRLLTDENGEPVLDEEGNLILITEDGDLVDEDGEIIPDEVLEEILPDFKKETTITFEDFTCDLETNDFDVTLHVNGVARFLEDEEEPETVSDSAEAPDEFDAYDVDGENEAEDIDWNPEDLPLPPADDEWENTEPVPAEDLVEWTCEDVEFILDPVTEGEEFEALMAQAGELEGEQLMLQVLRVKAYLDGKELDISECTFTIEMWPKPATLLEQVKKAITLLEEAANASLEEENEANDDDMMIFTASVSNDAYGTEDGVFFTDDADTPTEDESDAEILENEEEAFILSFFNMSGYDSIRIDRETMDLLLERMTGDEEADTALLKSLFEQPMLLTVDGDDPFAAGGQATGQPNPKFTVQYYANLDVLATTGINPVTMIDTSGENLPTNKGNTTTLPTGKNKNMYVDADGNVQTVNELTEVYSSRNYEYHKAPTINYMNALIKNTNYELEEIWILKAGKDASSTDEADWDVYPEDNKTLSDLHFTNREVSAESGEYILLQDNAVIRFVYGTTTMDNDFEAAFYDYDISNGRVHRALPPDNPDQYVYKTAGQTFSGNSLTSEVLTWAAGLSGWDGHLYAYTKEQGINSSGNYSGSGTKFAFGNVNTGTNLGKLTWSSENGQSNELNKYNNKGYQGCTFGLVTGLGEDGKIQYAKDINAPKLFNEGPATGKTSYSNYSLKFNRVGDTYTLTAVNGTGATNLGKFTNPENSQGNYDGKHYDSEGKLIPAIWTNNFWPMDSAASFGTGTHDVKFGGTATFKNNCTLEHPAHIHSNDNKCYDENGKLTCTKHSTTHTTEDKCYDESGKLTCTTHITTDDHEIRFGPITQRGTDHTFPESDDGLYHNSYFGMQYAVEFELTADYVGPLEYYFFGDDDMWVFLAEQKKNENGELEKDENGDPIYAASKLVCDIGGVHSSVGEYVNLWDYIDREKLEEELKETKKESKPYKLSFFYTERGASGSTCWMQFTLPSVSSLTPETTDEDYGDLEIRKEVVNGSDNDEFSFTIELTDAAGKKLPDDYSYLKYDKDGNEIGYDLIIWDGGTFTLRNGEYIVIKYLPEGAKWKVTEQNMGTRIIKEDKTNPANNKTEELDLNEVGFITTGTSSGDGKITNAEERVAEGTVGKGTTVSFSFVNAVPYNLPHTGGPNTIMYTTGGALLIMAAAGVLLYSRSKRKEAADRT